MRSAHCLIRKFLQPVVIRHNVRRLQSHCENSLAGALIYKGYQFVVDGDKFHGLGAEENTL